MLVFLKMGYRCQRAGWNGKGMHIELIDNWGMQKYPTSLPRLPFIAMQTVDGAYVPWLASQTDILAEDWTVLQERVDEQTDPVP